MVKEKRGVRFNFQSVKPNNKNYFYKKRVAVRQSFFFVGFFVTRLLVVNLFSFSFPLMRI